MPRIEMSDLIQAYPQMTAEQVNLIKGFYTKFDNRAAANQRIINVEPLYYLGTSVGTEFLTYAATKLYICFNLITDRGGVSSSQSVIIIYNEANAAFISGGINYAYWNATTAAVNYSASKESISNFYFSKLVLSGYTYISFNGFRITLV